MSPVLESDYPDNGFRPKEFEVLKVYNPPMMDSFLFCLEGLSNIFTEAQIAELNPVSSSDPYSAMRYGAYRCAHRQFFHPEE